MPSNFAADMPAAVGIMTAIRAPAGTVPMLVLLSSTGIASCIVPASIAAVIIAVVICVTLMTDPATSLVM